MEGADELAAHLHDAAVVEHRLLDPAARPPARLQQLYVGAGRRQVARRRETREAGAQDEHVAHQRSTCPCSGCQPTRTRSPSSQRSSERARAVFCSSATSRAPGASSTISWVAVPM